MFEIDSEVRYIVINDKSYDILIPKEKKEAFTMLERLEKSNLKYELINVLRMKREDYD